MRQHNPLAPLIDIARRGTSLSASDGQAFVRLGVPSGGFYILPVRSPAYRDWFLHEFFNLYDTLPTSRAFHAILNHLEAEANHHGQAQRLAVWRQSDSVATAPCPPRSSSTSPIPNASLSKSLHRLEDHRRYRCRLQTTRSTLSLSRARRLSRSRRPRNPPRVSQSSVPCRLAPLPRLAPRRPPPRRPLSHPHPARPFRLRQILRRPYPSHHDRSLPCPSPLSLPPSANSSLSPA